MPARRKEETAEERGRRELVEGFFRHNPVSDMGELQNILREMKRQMIEGSLEGELEGELGYTRYDYRNKETDNSRSW